MGIIGWIIVGGLMGALAKLIMPGKDPGGIIVTILIGVVGGLLGGIATTTVIAVLLAPVLTPLSMYYAVIAGVVISMAGFFGDVTISAVKRDLGVKDFGTTLPGHGGILDRVDSLTYTAPLFFHLVKFVYY